MKTYYSIVSIAPKSHLNEKFNVGLVCVTPTETFFHYSQPKFKIVSKLLSLDGSKLALSALEGINKQINAPVGNTDLFRSTDSLSLVSENYLNYLHRYNNNLIQFSEPIQLDLEVDRTVFELLFKKYIFSSEIFAPVFKSEKSQFSIVSKNLLAKAKSYANINFNVNSAIIKDLIVPVTVDIFGKNGAFVTSQLIDFTKSKSGLMSEVSSYLYLVEKTGNVDSKSKSFIVGNEPSKKEELNHKIWLDLRKTKLVEVISLDESEQIIEYMEQKGVMPIQS